MILGEEMKVLCEAIKAGFFELFNVKDRGADVFEKKNDYPQDVEEGIGEEATTAATTTNIDVSTLPIPPPTSNNKDEESGVDIYACTKCRKMLIPKVENIRHNMKEESETECNASVIISHKTDNSEISNIQVEKGIVQCKSCNVKLGKFHEKEISCACGFCISGPVLKLQVTKLYEGVTGAVNDDGEILDSLAESVAALKLDAEGGEKPAPAPESIVKNKKDLRKEKREKKGKGKKGQEVE